MEKGEKMERLPPIAPAFRNYDYNYPRSLVLYLQCAPYRVVLAAFQADCESRDISWCSARAQDLAVEWFLHHPVAKKYPPRKRMLRALLKAYITSIEEQRVVERASAACTSEEEAVQLELMEAYIEISVLGGEDPHVTEMSFKTFFNPYVGKVDWPTACASNTPVPAPSSTSTSADPLVHLTAVNSSPPQSNEHTGGFKFHTFSAGSNSLGATAPTSRVPRPMNGSSHPMAPRSGTPDRDNDDLQWMLNMRAASPNTPLQSPFSSSHAAPQPVDKVLEQFCAVRVSSDQFSNAGLSLWPAAFVMVQLLAQEFKGETHLLSDVLGLPRTPGGAMGGNGTPMPALSPPQKNLGSSISTPPSSLSSSGRGSRSTAIGGGNGATTASAGKPYSSQLRILELGAGVGLTPLFLHHMEEYRQHVATFLATDYQDTIIDNIKFNFKENGITPVEDFTAAKRGLEGDQTPPFHRAAKLNWVNHLDNEGMFMENSVDVVLAADCIYDVDVIPALVDTIHLALTSEDISSYLTFCGRQSQAKSDIGNGSSAANKLFAQTPQKQRCCIIVQTHRQNSTMQAFFSAVRKFGQVRSYTLVRQPIGTLHLSQDGSGIDGGCIPLGNWDKQLALLNPDRVVCVLKHDVVQENGAMGSMSKLPASTPVRNNSILSNTIVSSPGGTGRSHHRSVHNIPVSSFGKDTPAATSLHSSRSVGSSDSRMSFSRNSAAAVMEAAETLLADEMIGPFYTSMVGLIGVHVITLKPSKKMKR